MELPLSMVSKLAFWYLYLPDYVIPETLPKFRMRERVYNHDIFNNYSPKAK